MSASSCCFHHLCFGDKRKMSTGRWRILLLLLAPVIGIAGGLLLPASVATMTIVGVFAGVVGAALYWFAFLRGRSSGTRRREKE